MQQRFGKNQGMRVFRDFRSAEDPEAPVTVLKKRFKYQAPPKARQAPRRRAAGPRDAAPVGGRHAERRRRGGRVGHAASGLSRASLPMSASNAVLIAGRNSASGHPLMVAGPQVSYFNPQILTEQDVHAPASGDLPGIDARGASFIGVNLYVQLGRGRDYAWSATSAGQDNIDTFALRLCEPGGGKPTLAVDALPLPRRVPAGRGAGQDQHVAADRRRRHAGRDAEAARGADQARAGRGPRARARPPHAVREAALDLLPRGRLGRRLHGLQRPGAGARRRELPARGEPDRLHVQLVLRGPGADRVLQLGQQPRAREGDRSRLPGRGQAAARVARVGPGPLDRALLRGGQAPAGRSTRST